MRPCDGTYCEQMATAERLSQLNRWALLLTVGAPEKLDTLYKECRAAKRDLYTYVTSALLSIDYYDVRPVERAIVKDALFFYLYGRRPSAVILSPDCIILTRWSPRP